MKEQTAFSPCTYQYFYSLHVDVATLLLSLMSLLWKRQEMSAFWRIERCLTRAHYQLSFDVMNMQVEFQKVLH